MAKRQTLNYDSAELTNTLKQSAGRGMNAFFPDSPPPSTPSTREQPDKQQPATPKPKRRTAKKKSKSSSAPAAKQSPRRPVENPPADADRNRGATKEHKIEGTNDAMTPTPQSRPQDPTTASSNDTAVSRHHDTTTPPIEPIRRAVKQIGKEAATHRFTVDEKRAIADIVYTLGQQGYRTSENELARIAINSLLLDYKEHGEQSILYRVIKALNE